MPRFPLFIALALLSAVPFSLAQTGVSRLVELQQKGSVGLRLRLEKAGLDMLPPPVGKPDLVRLILAPGEEQVLKAMNLGWQVRQLGRPLKKVIGAIDAPPDAKYYTHAEINALLTQTEKSFPALAKVYDLTTYTGAPKTHENRHIYGIKISDNVGVDEDEPNVLILAEHHAREVNTQVMVVEAIRRFTRDYATNAQIKSWVDNNEIWLIPVVNPDGLEYVWNKDNMWRKNRRDNGGGSYGVDPNRNYPFRWKQCGYSTNPNYSTYLGPSPGSEPCVQTVMKLSDLRHFERVLDFHSSGREILFTYSPCTKIIPPPVKTYLDAAIASLRTVSTYNTRWPSASGEHPEWQLYRRGSLAYLVEIMRSFQPTYAASITEEKTYVWPLEKRFLSFPVPLTGHVRDLGGKPLAATVRVSGVNWNYGEEIRSGGPHGRYFVWLTAGTYDFTFSAPGYQPFQVKETLSNMLSRTRDVVLLPLAGVLTKSGPGKLGTAAAIKLTVPAGAGLPYFIGTALGTSPGQKVGNRLFPLNPDALFTTALLLPSVFVNSVGFLDAAGMGTMTMQIPMWPALAGNKFYFAGFAVDYSYPLYVRNISNAIDLPFIP